MGELPESRSIHMDGENVETTSGPSAKSDPIPFGRPGRVRIIVSFKGQAAGI
jgi:hypothetical protein